MVRTKADIKNNKNTTQEAARWPVPPSNVQLNEVKLEMVFFASSNKTFTSKFHLRYDDHLNIYLIRKIFFEKLSKSLVEQGFTFNTKTSSVEGVVNKKQFSQMITSIIETAMDEFVEKGSNNGKNLECTKWLGGSLGSEHNMVGTTFKCFVLE